MKVFKGQGRSPEQNENENEEIIIDEKTIQALANYLKVFNGSGQQLPENLPDLDSKIIQILTNYIRVFNGRKKHPIHHIKNDNILIGINERILKEMLKIDANLDPNSENALQNKAIYNLIQEIYESISQLGDITYEIIS